LQKYFSALIVVTCLFAPALLAGDGSVKRAVRSIPGRYLVLLDDSVTDDVAETVGDLVKRHSVKLDGIFQNTIKGGVFEMSDGQAQAISRDSRVASVWEDEIMEATASVVARSWSVDRIDERMAPRLDGKYDFCQTGRGVRAYVVDSGIWKDHDEFSNPDPETGGSRVPIGYDAERGAVHTDSNNPPCNHADTTLGSYTMPRRTEREWLPSWEGKRLA
jgi:hypothetical protein